MNERAAAMAKLYTEDGLTLEQVGEKFGVTAQRVRQILMAAGVPIRSRQHTGKSRKAKADASRADAQLAELLRRMANAKPCVVCGAWVLRGDKRITCSVECGQLWPSLRLVLSDERHARHRVHQANTILRSPEKYSLANVAWAKKVLAGDDPGPNRRYTIEGSAPDRAVQSKAAEEPSDE